MKNVLATTLFIVHGANMSSDDIGELEAKVRERVREMRVPVQRIEMPRWREQAGVKLGPSRLTLPKSTGRTVDETLMRLVGRMMRGEFRTTDVIAHKARGYAVKEGYQLLGDVMSYARHRARIHEVLRRGLRTLADEQVVVVGHSLGGVAMVDLMAEQPEPNVKIVVTLGSQAPLLYTLDGLEGFSDGRPPFAPWINVWDQDDLLSFVAGPVFEPRPGATQPIIDVEAASKTLMPEAHSFYWQPEGAAWSAIKLAVYSAVVGATFESGETSVSLLAALADGARDRYHRDAEEYRLKVIENIEARINLAEAQSREFKQKMRRFFAEHAVDMIESNDVLANVIERTSSRYYSIMSASYVIWAGDLDSAKLEALIARYEPLRPEKIDDDVWLTVFVGRSALVTDEAVKLLRKERVGVFRVEDTVISAGAGDSSAE